MKARVDVRKTAKGWEVFRWQIGSRPWRTLDDAGGQVDDPFISEACPTGFKLFPGARRLVPVRREGYWDADGELSKSTYVRAEMDYPLSPKGLLGLGRRCQARFNDRTNTLTGCGRPAFGRFTVSDSSLKRRRVWLCIECGTKATSGGRL